MKKKWLVIIFLLAAVIFLSAASQCNDVIWGSRDFDYDVTSAEEAPNDSNFDKDGYPWPIPGGGSSIASLPNDPSCDPPQPQNPPPPCVSYVKIWTAKGSNATGNPPYDKLNFYWTGEVTTDFTMTPSSPLVNAKSWRFSDPVKKTVKVYDDKDAKGALIQDFIIEPRTSGTYTYDYLFPTDGNGNIDTNANFFY